MEFKEAAYHVLKGKNKPLTAREITEIALSNRLIESVGKTPHATMGAEIYKDIERRGGKSLFVKKGKGLFGLSEWVDGRAIETSKSEKPKGVNAIVELLNRTQLKSESPAEFEEAIKEAFVFLGFEGELIGGSGDTDVLLTANIGQHSFRVSVDGKTSKVGKIIDRQIDWISLSDHKRKNKAEYIVVVGCSFAGGNLLDRANQYSVSLVKTDDLVKLIEAHASFPFTLIELRDLFAGKGEISTQLVDLLSQNHSRRNILEQFLVIIEEMQALQDRLGYFTYDSLAGREKIEELEIEPVDIDYIIKLLRLPFVNGVQEINNGRYILALRVKDIANLFQQIANLLVSAETDIEEKSKSEVLNLSMMQLYEQEKRQGSKYFNWYVSGQSVVAEARKESPYKHHCPINHLERIVQVIIQAYKSQNLVNVDLIFSMLDKKDLTPGRPFKGKTEDYKIRMALGILEIEGLIKWTGSKRPIEYKIEVQPDYLYQWFQLNILKRSKNE